MNHSIISQFERLGERSEVWTFPGVRIEPVGCPRREALTLAILNNLITPKKEPRLIAKLVQITPIPMVYGTYNYSHWGL